MDHFSDPGSAMALMAGFLNSVGQRREAVALLERWKEMVRLEFTDDRVIKICDLVKERHFRAEEIRYGNGLELLGEEAFQLHPNETSEPDACCYFDVLLFGHNQLRGTLEVRNRRSAPVEFDVAVMQQDRVISQGRFAVAPGSPTDFDLRIEPVVGRAELRLRTRMVSATCVNHYAWATWDKLAFRVI